MVNWLKLQGIKVHSEYCFSGQQCKSVDSVYCFQDVTQCSLVAHCQRIGSKRFAQTREPTGFET
jgi:hypothetical protein